MAVNAEELLEREAQISELRDLTAGAARGEGSIALVEAPPGLGKTSLLAWASASAQEAGAQVLLGRGGELERAFPFGVCIQLFDAALEGRGPDERDRLLSGAAARARPLFEERAGPASPPAEDALFSFVHGLYWLTSGLAEEGPVLLAIDDAHWADAPSLHFLTYLARRVEELPVAVVVATRPSRPGNGAGALDALRVEGSRRLLSPGPLSRAAVGELVRGELGEPGPEVEDACWAATRGNPLYLRELFSALRQEPVDVTARSVEALAGGGEDAVSRSVPMHH